MQTLWSRVAQAQSTCRCRVCLHPPNALARRSTTAAARRRVTGADLFTACYTTILGTAVVIDSKRKEVRRQELDEKLQNARASLSSLAVQEAPNVLQEFETQPLQRRELGDDVDHESTGDKEPRDLSELIGELARIAGNAIAPWSRPALHDGLVNWLAIQEDIKVEEEDRLGPGREPKSSTQMQKTTQSVEALIQMLLWQVRHSGNANQATKSQSRGDGELEEAEQLLGQYPSYTSPDIDPVETNKTRRELNKAIRNVFRSCSDAREAVGKICYNLLISSVPPSIHSWNTLIMGFNHIQRPDLAQIVVEFYLDETRSPATQSTMVCLLNHAKVTNNLDLFRETVGRMRGTREDGLHIRIVDKERIYDDRGLEWARRYAASRKYAFVERAQPSQTVFNTIVQGWLHFGKVETAITAFMASVRAGSYVSVDVIHHLLSMCVSTLSQRSACSLIRKLAVNLDNLESLLRYVLDQATAHVAHQIGELFGALLDLSGYAEKSIERSTFEEVTDSLRLFQKHVTLAEVAPNGDLNSVIMVGRLAHQCQNLELKTKRIAAHVKVSVVKHQTGYNLDHRNCLPPIDLHQYAPNAPHPEVLYALQAISLSKDLETRSQIKSQLVAGLPNQVLAKKIQQFGSLEGLSVPTLINLYRPHRQSIPTPASMTSVATRWLEEKVFDIEDTIKAILFCHIDPDKQRHYSTTCADWHSLPVERLYKATSQMLLRKIRREHEDMMILRKRAKSPTMHQPHLVDPNNSTRNMNGDVDLQWEQPGEEPIWDEKDVPRRKHADSSYSVVETVPGLIPTPRRELWSDRSLGQTTYQHAEAAS